MNSVRKLLSCTPITRSTPIDMKVHSTVWIQTGGLVRDVILLRFGQIPLLQRRS